MTTSLEAYEAKQDEIKTLLRQINVALLKHDRDGSQDSLGHHWGYVGDLAHVAAELKDLRDFLTGNEENR